MPKVHSLAYVYMYEQTNDDGLVECDNCPYPLIPKVTPMKRAAQVLRALNEPVDDAHVFAVARSYMAEKFIRCKTPASVNISVLSVEKKINPHYLQAFNDARVYFGLPGCYLYRDTTMRRLAQFNQIVTTRIDYDDDYFDLPPEYSQYSAAIQMPIRPHCHTCSCSAHASPPQTPSYEESPTISSPSNLSSPSPRSATPLSPVPTRSAAASPIPSSSLSSTSPLDASSASLSATVSPRRRTLLFWR